LIDFIDKHYRKITQNIGGCKVLKFPYFRVKFKTMENNCDFKIDFLGIGVPRGGTSWIYQCLGEHPQICTGRGKELRFLDDPIKYNQGLKFYASFFSHCKKGQIKGEYSPGYLEHVDQINHSLIKKYFPSVKFIVCFRNPIERAYSAYITHKLTQTTSIKTFEEALKGPLKHYYLGMGFYAASLKKFMELYPRNEFLILINEDIAKDPLKFIRGVYKFLGVDPNFVPPSAYQQVDWPATNAMRIPFLNLAIADVKRFFYLHPKNTKPVVSFLKLLQIHKLVNFIWWANGRKRGLKRYQKPPMLEETRRYLQGVYREDIKNLEKLINRDLSFWK